MVTNTILLFAGVIALVGFSKGFPSNSDSKQISGWLPNRKLQWNFSVELDHPLKPNEKLGITGNVDFLGAWSPNKALFLNSAESATRWSGSVRFPANSIVNYRYFVGVVDSIDDGVQIRKWETHLDGRTVKLGRKNIETTDRFGIVKQQKEIRRGWLNSGCILQFKLFHNPIQLNDLNVMNQRMFVKVTAVDYDASKNEKLLKPIPSSGRADIEVIRMEYGNSQIRDQLKYGIPYERDDIVIFHITTNDRKNVAYKFTVGKEDEKDPEMVHTVGYQYLYPETFDGSEGSTELVLMSSDGQSSIGTINIEYLLIKPLSTEEVSFETTFSHYWRKNWTSLDVGHRGLGVSLEVSKEEAAPIIENTVASMKKSADINVDLVEFDVHLTSDLIPIIYHDFVIKTCLSEKKCTSKDDLNELLIKDLTYEKLKNLKTYQVVNSKVIEYPSHNMEPQEDLRMFPLFEDFLTKVDHKVGFNIEIKWPQLQTNGQYESNQTIDKNVYVDRILGVMLRKGCGRLSFFSSLDADICTMVQFKQNMYSVMFLEPMKPDLFVDPRSDSFEQVINNAQAMGMLGVVPHSSNFLKNGSLTVDFATNLDLKVFIWGDDSNSKERVEYFKSLGPNGVIYDRIDKWMPKKNENAFSEERDLPEFFEKQCIY